LRKIKLFPRQWVHDGFVSDILGEGNMKPRSCPSRAQGGASGWVLGGFAAVALFFLLTEHRAHFFGWLPYILLAACPLMHLLHGHGGHSRHGSRTPSEPHHEP
jgi:hypothetical protein